jgi:hypothetical protein
MRIKRKEIVLGVILSTFVMSFAVYSSVKNAEERRATMYLRAQKADLNSYGTTSTLGSQPYTQLVSEVIEGDLNKGTFESVVGELEILTEETAGYVKSLHMTYEEGVWSGVMICKVPPTNVTSFTFGARGIIDANGTVTYINISVESVNASEQTEENAYSTINFNLKEVKQESGKNEIIASITSAFPILATGLVWVAEGLIIAVPLCFASLGVVMLVNRGIIPLWKNTLKKPK